MPEIHVPKVPHRVNPRDPKTDPNYEKAVRVGQRRIKTGKHKLDPEEKEKYDKLVRSNPLNVPGIPAFYPPLTIRSAMNDVKAARECRCGGCATYRDNFECPRCGVYVKGEERWT